MRIEILAMNFNVIIETRFMDRWNFNNLQQRRKSYSGHRLLKSFATGIANKYEFRFHSSDDE